MPSAISPPPETGYRHFQVDRHSLSLPSHYDVTEINGDGAFYMGINSIKRKVPSLTMRAGSTAEGPVVAVCHFILLGGHFKLGFGDPAQVDSVEWEDMTRQNLAGSEFRWETALVAGDAQRALTWKRTHSVVVEGMTLSGISMRNFKLLDDTTGDVMAVFTSKRTMRNCGVLEMRVNLGEAFDQMAILTCMSLYEKMRRD